MTIKQRQKFSSNSSLLAILVKNSCPHVQGHRFCTYFLLLLTILKRLCISVIGVQRPGEQTHT